MEPIDRITPVAAVLPYAVGAAPISEPGQQPSDAAGTQRAEGSGTADAVSGLECETCENRTYQDRSDDPGVSFQAPTRLSPNEAASAVMSHEMEHYNREEAKAEREGREVLSNDIRIFTSVCPECGRTYVSGGETRTVTRAEEEQGEFAKQFFDDMLGGSKAEQIDEKV